MRERGRGERRSEGLASLHEEVRSARRRGGRTRARKRGRERKTAERRMGMGIQQTKHWVSMGICLQ